MTNKKNIDFTPREWIIDATINKFQTRIRPSNYESEMQSCFDNFDITPEDLSSFEDSTGSLRINSSEFIIKEDAATQRKIRKEEEITSKSLDINNSNTVIRQKKKDIEDCKKKIVDNEKEDISGYNKNWMIFLSVCTAICFLGFWYVYSCIIFRAQTDFTLDPENSLWTSVNNFEFFGFTSIMRFDF